MNNHTPQEYQNGLFWFAPDEENFFLGLTQKGLDQVGSIQGLDLGEVGDEFSEGDWVGEIKGKDYILEIVAPFDLQLVERNEELYNQISTLEDDPTGDAWLLRVTKRDDL